MDDGDEDAEMREKREMLEKIKDAANGPEHAKRRIEALDKMVNALKTRRRNCGDRQVLERPQAVTARKVATRIE